MLSNIPLADVLANITACVFHLIWCMADQIIWRLLCYPFKLCTSNCCKRRNSVHAVQTQNENKVCSSCTVLHQQITRLQEEKEELSRKLSPNKGGPQHLSFTDFDDEYTNQKLKYRFLEIRRKEWIGLYRCLSKTYQNELRVIETISDIMKNLYEECRKEADKRLCAVFGGCFPSPDEFPDIYKFRRISCQQKIAVQEIATVIKERYAVLDQTQEHRSSLLDLSKLATCAITSSDERTTSEDSDSSKLRNMCVYPGSPSINDHDKLERFVDAFVECSWLMIVAIPPIELHFDVLDKLFDADMEQRFEKYSTKEKVLANKTVDTITQVVWPGLDDNHCVHARGCVVTVDQSCGTEV